MNYNKQTSRWIQELSEQEYNGDIELLKLEMELNNIRY